MLEKKKFLNETEHKKSRIAGTLKTKKGGNPGCREMSEKRKECSREK